MLNICKSLLIAGAVAALAVSQSASACTTFASIGTANFDGGLIIAKNRDSMATYENLAVRSTPGKNSYLGLFYNTSSTTPYPYIAAGINEHGLSVVQNEAASVYNPNTFNDADQSVAIYAILANYSSVAEVLADQQTLFGNGLANFLIIGDKSEAILVEVGRSRRVQRRVGGSCGSLLAAVHRFTYSFLLDVVIARVVRFGLGARLQARNLTVLRILLPAAAR